jgi:hypothetical protein
VTDSTAGRPNAATFEPHRGSEFTLTNDGVARVLRLDEVTAYEGQPGAPRSDPFTLVFSAEGPVLDQRIHGLAHAALGALDIFLVPIGQDADGRVRYEAVFN